MKKILGLDLGTNSIGWMLIEQDFEAKIGKILGDGVRVIPMSQEVLDNFGGGTPSKSQTAVRTGFRGTRRLRERHLLRRERLHRVLNILGFLPKHYASQIDFEKRLGQFLDETEPKIAWKEIQNEQKNKNDFEFIFQKSFYEMVDDFKANEQNTKIPYDWTIYYLRKKALIKKIEKEELAWIILNFNQKRGYYQLRGEEEEENPNKLVEFHSLKIIDVVADEKPNTKGDTWYSLHLENGWIYRRSSKMSLFDWNGKVRDFIVTTDLNDDGTIKTDKDGYEKRSFRAPSEDDWTLLKKKTEANIEHSQKNVGTYIYETLLENPSQKIRGKLVRTIERKFYKEELIAILKKQIELQPELFTEDLYNDCIRELYRNNEAHQLALSKRNFEHLFVNDIIFYQRPLKSQKSSIGNCTLEYRKHKDKDGNEIKEYLKAIPKSNPLYQEFRLWQWLFNLKIYKRDDDTDVTEQFITNITDKEKLFDFLNNRKEIDQKALLKYFKLTEKTYRWNFVEDKNYPCNETGMQIRTRLAKVENVPADFLTSEIEQKLWHIIYSVTDKNEFEKGLKTFAVKHNLDGNSFVENFKKFPPFKSEYGSFSEKAIKKLLLLMRLGKYWNWELIDTKTRDRISKIITGEYDEAIKNQVRNKAIDLKSENDFQGLQLWLAQYIVYDTPPANKWNSVADLEKYLEEFKQHSLRNPIVEQVITETLRVVRDIWKEYGVFSEIHIELGREMKHTTEERKRLTNIVTENENTNLRIKALIMELKGYPDIKDVRPYSPIQQEKLKIYEEYAISNIEENDVEKEFIQKISKVAQPSKSELQRYKLWLEQKYCSPYTGQAIPLGKLFTEEYQVEHIIPQSRYFDDSFSNKVICEAAVNQLKDKQLGLEFIKNHHGEKIDCGSGKKIEISSEDAYRYFVKEHYAKNYAKRNKLLLEEIPEKMIERQMNDTRSISKLVSQLLSNIVREDKNDDGVNSKNLIAGNGKITTILKRDWGLNEVWNALILPRFKRMNELTGTEDFTSKNQEGHIIPSIPLELSKGFQKKRIDHRHHAMDALVIACATRDHINLLNNQSAKSENSRYDLQHKLRNTEKKTYFDKNENKQVTRDVFTEFKKPWDKFTDEARKELEKIVVSFKQNLRVVSKTTNKYESYKDENGNIRVGKNVKPEKGILKQKGANLAIRKSLHTPMPYGKKTYEFDILRIADFVGKRKFIIDDNIRNKVEVVFKKCNEKITDAQKLLRKSPIQDDDGNPIIVTAFKINTEKFRQRQPISELSNRGIGGIKTYDDAIKFINKVADFKLRIDLLNHLKNNKNDIDLAFSAEGIERFNINRKIPVYRLPIVESGSSRFRVGNTIGTRHKWVEADTGTNLFFAIYVDKDGNRSYETIQLNKIIDKLKQKLPAVPEVNENGCKLLFYLNPNDLVYVPKNDEIENKKIEIDRNRIYRFTDSSGSTANFVPANIAKVIFNYSKDKQKRIDYKIQNEIGLGSLRSKNENTITGEQQIKSVCLKLKVDRLGNVKLNGE